MNKLKHKWCMVVGHMWVKEYRTISSDWQCQRCADRISGDVR